MNCPTCQQPASFVPANQNWWCNGCLASHAGPAPTGLVGPTADQISADASLAQPTSSGWNLVSDVIFDAAILFPLMAVVGGGLLIYFGSWIIGTILIAAVIGGGMLMG